MHFSSISLVTVEATFMLISNSRLIRIMSIMQVGRSTLLCSSAPWVT